MENSFGCYFKYRCGFYGEDMQDPQLKPDRKDI